MFPRQDRGTIARHVRKTFSRRRRQVTMEERRDTMRNNARERCTSVRRLNSKIGSRGSRSCLYCRRASSTSRPTVFINLCRATLDPRRARTLRRNSWGIHFIHPVPEQECEIAVRVAAKPTHSRSRESDAYAAPRRARANLGTSAFGDQSCGYPESHIMAARTVEPSPSTSGYPRAAKKAAPRAAKKAALRVAMPLHELRQAREMTQKALEAL